MNSPVQLKPVDLYSIYDMINMENKDIENKIFIVNQSDAHPNQINPHYRYVQIKQTRYIKTSFP